MTVDTQQSQFNPRPFVLVFNPGTDEEDIYNDYKTYTQAISAFCGLYPEDRARADIMLRQDDGRLTTDF